MINKKQKVLVWHVDYLHVSHLNSFEVTKFAVYLSSIYWGLIVHRGKVHEYLGIDLNYSEKLKVKLSMIE